MGVLSIVVAAFLLTVPASGQGSLAIHGISVGLPLSAVNDLIRTTAWGQRYGDDRNQRLESDPVVPMLTADDYDVYANPKQRHPFQEWVCVGAADCLYWDGVDLRFRDDTVAGVWVTSQSVDLDDLNAMLGYAERLVGDVQNQLGGKKPVRRLSASRMRRAIRSISREHASVSVAEWRWKHASGTKHVLAHVGVEVRRLPNRRLQLDLILRDHTITAGHF